MSTENQGLKIPTCGRMVHYFPMASDKHSAANGAQVVPALVIQSWDDRNSHINLSVFTMNPDGPNVLRYSVCHKSDPTRSEDQAYWDWPEIK